MVFVQDLRLKTVDEGWGNPTTFTTRSESTEKTLDVRVGPNVVGFYNNAEKTHEDKEFRPELLRSVGSIKGFRNFV